MKYVGWVPAFILLVASTLCAMDVQVDRSFKIVGIDRTEGKLVLPAEHKKYSDIRIVDRGTFNFVRKCTEPCIQTLVPLDFIVHEIRPAQTHEDMWIVSVDFNQAWLITFLVFKQRDSFSIKGPKHFIFLDPVLELRTREMILKAVSSKKL